MKKLITLMVSIAMAAALVSCGDTSAMDKLIEKAESSSAAAEGTLSESADSSEDGTETDESEIDDYLSYVPEPSSNTLADKIDGMILPRMRRCWRWRQLYLRAKIDEAVYSARDARTPAALTAYGELTNLYHAEKQVERLYDGTWRGYTCPPFADHE